MKVSPKCESKQKPVTTSVLSGFPGFNFFLWVSALVLLDAPTLLAQTVTSTTLATSPTICASTSSLTLTATVSPDPQGGTVQFQVDGIHAGSPENISSGSASFNYNPSGLTAGNHSVTAIFNGNESFSASTSSSVTLVVNGINPGTIAKGLSNQGPVCASLNPNITLVPNGSTSVAATGNGTITYLWQQSTDGGITWITAPIVSPETSNTNVQFNPGTMTTTTKLRRMAISTQNSVSCYAYSNELEYIVHPLPTVAAITTPTNSFRVCEGSTLQLLNETSGGIWDSNNAANININSSGLVTGISAAAQTNLNINYKVTDGNGCSRTVNKTISVIALPTVTSSASVCVGATFNLTPGSGGVWVSNHTDIASVTGAGLVTGVATGTATFTFTGSTAPGCSKTTQLVKVGCDPMPVTLVDFSLKNKENAVLLTWKTTSELNSSHFEIEKGINAVSGFTRIASVSSYDSQSGGNYHYEDCDLSGAKTIYYRLKMVDWDETFAYSRILQIKPNPRLETELFPNPASQFLNIKMYDWQNVTSIRIRRVNGDYVYQFEGSQLSKKLEISKLSPGLYIIEITRNNGTGEIRKFSVTR